MEDIIDQMNIETVFNRLDTFTDYLQVPSTENVTNKEGFQP